MTLSCCHSGCGKILTAGGVVGIARAFLGSGARPVLVSLGAVDDKSTKEYMEIFYTYLIHERLGASEALHQAMKNMRVAESGPQSCKELGSICSTWRQCYI